MIERLNKERAKISHMQPSKNRIVTLVFEFCIERNVTPLPPSLPFCPSKEVCMSVPSEIKVF
jgi:hypothetical protein